MIRKRILVSLLVLGLSVLLAGCALLQGIKQPLTFAASPISGHPTLEDSGLVVTFYCNGGDGNYELDPGDGTVVLSYETTEFPHTYTQAGTYKAKLYSGAALRTVTIHVTNEDPCVRSPDWHARGVRFGRSVSEGEEISFDPMPREIQHGCSASGDPIDQWVTGITDGDGDPIEIRLTITRANGISESIFIKHGLNDYEEVSGQWVPLQILTWFADYACKEPRYPYLSLEDESRAVLTCVLEGRDPWGGYGKIEWYMYSGLSCCPSVDPGNGQPCSRP